MKQKCGFESYQGARDLSATIHRCNSLHTRYQPIENLKKRTWRGNNSFPSPFLQFLSASFRLNQTSYTGFVDIEGLFISQTVKAPKVNNRDIASLETKTKWLVVDFCCWSQLESVSWSFPIGKPTNLAVLKLCCIRSRFSAGTRPVDIFRLPPPFGTRLPFRVSSFIFVALPPPPTA